MLFTVAALCVALGAVLWIARPLVRARVARTRAAYDEQVFRDQLAEIGRDRERGVLSAEESEAARIEVSRRLLAAAAEREASPDHRPAPRAASYALAATLLVAAPLAGWTLYQSLGAPNLPDQPHGGRSASARPSQDVAEAELARRFGAPPDAQGSAEFAALVAQLEERLAGDAPDPEGLGLLAQSQARIGRYADAWRSWRRLIDASGENATAAMHSSLAETMILATHGYVSPEAEAALAEALKRAPADPVARYYSGVALAQAGDVRAAFDAWTGLIADSPEGAPWIDATRAQIAGLAERTGRPTPVIPGPRAPTAQERRALTADMAAQIEGELAGRAGPAGEWLQLILAYDLLGDSGLADGAAARARTALADRPAQAALLDAALGLSPRAAGDAQLEAARGLLSERLARDPVDPAGWLRLVASEAALGQFEAARDAAFLARDALAASPEALADFTVAIGGPAALAPPEGGPDAAAVEAAAEMSTEDRETMIRGMVAGLQERLFEESGAPEDWARLFQALGVLGDADAATEAFARAREAFADDPVTVSALAERAALAGARIE